jgi:general secretion pathway protein G
MESGQSQQKQNAAEVRREISELRRTILMYVLDDSVTLPDFPLLEEFKTEHARLRTEIAAAMDRASRLQAARDEYVDVLGHFNTAKTEYEQSKKALAKLHKPLGQAAFAAFQTGGIPRQQEFIDRIALAERITGLKKEQERLAAPPDAGIVEKTKAKARQLAIAAKIKGELLSAGKLDAEIGRALIDYERDHVVRSALTSDISDKVCAARAETTSCKHDLELAEQSFTTKAAALSQALGLQQIAGKYTFDVEIAALENQAKEKHAFLSTRELELLDLLANRTSGLVDTPIGALLRRLTGLLKDEHLASKRTTNRDPREIVRAISTWKAPYALTSRRVTTGLASLAIALVFALVVWVFVSERSDPKRLVIGKWVDADDSDGAVEILPNGRLTLLSVDRADHDVGQYRWNSDTEVDVMLPLIGQVVCDVHVISNELNVQPKRAPFLERLRRRFNDQQPATFRPITFRRVTEFATTNPTAHRRNEVGADTSRSGWKEYRDELWGPHGKGNVAEDYVAQTRNNIKTLQQILTMYALDHDGQYPSGGRAALTSLTSAQHYHGKKIGAYMDATPKDAWGEPLYYEYPTRKGEGDKPAVWSSGPNRQNEDGSRDDISSWSDR